MALDAVMSSPTFNCYISLADANTYMSQRLHTDVWDDAENSSREAALIWATKLLDSTFVWSGGKVDIDQNLGFPRNGLYDGDGYYVRSDIIPQQVKNATVEQALLLLSSDRTATGEPSSQGLKDLQVGTIKLSFDKEDKPPVVSDYIHGLLSGFYVSLKMGSSTVKLSRV